MKKKNVISKKNVVAEKEIPQLSRSAIIKKRENKIKEALGMFIPQEICKKCKFCKYYSLARTPFNSVFRQMSAWEQISEKVPCQYLDGMEEEDSKELTLIKGNTEACENFILNRERTPKEILDLAYNLQVGKAFNGEDTKDSERVYSDDTINKYSKRLSSDINNLSIEIDKARAQIQELKSKKEDLLIESREIYDSRFTLVNEFEDKPNLATILGEETRIEKETLDKNREKIEACGFHIGETKVVLRTITSEDVTRIQAHSKNSEYGGLFKNGVDYTGKKLSDYIGQQYEFEIEPYEVTRKVARKQVIFRETDACFNSRREIPILELLCGDVRQCWRFDAITKPELVDTDVHTDEEDVEETEETEN